MTLSNTLPWSTKIQFYKRAVLREVLIDLSVNGVRSDISRCITISFVSKYPFVQLPEYVLRNFPEKITIQLLADCFNKLQVNYFNIAVQLKFNPEHDWEQVIIPLAAITYFNDSLSHFTFESAPMPLDFMKNVSLGSNIIEFNAAN